MQLASRPAPSAPPPPRLGREEGQQASGSNRYSDNGIIWHR